MSMGWRPWWASGKEIRGVIETNVASHRENLWWQPVFGADGGSALVVRDALLPLDIDGSYRILATDPLPTAVMIVAVRPGPADGGAYPVATVAPGDSARLSLIDVLIEPPDEAGAREPEQFRIQWPVVDEHFQVPLNMPMRSQYAHWDGARRIKVLNLPLAAADKLTVYQAGKSREYRLVQRAANVLHIRLIKT